MKIKSTLKGVALREVSLLRPGCLSTEEGSETLFWVRNMNAFWGGDLRLSPSDNQQASSPKQLNGFWWNLISMVGSEGCRQTFPFVCVSPLWPALYTKFKLLFMKILKKRSS
jgi:hypothetical protein